MPHYFGYASNMNLGQMARRLGHPVTGRVGRLPGYRLVFNKPTGRDDHAYANLTADPAGAVLGVVYPVTDAELTRLDGFEGVPTGEYHRVPVVVDMDGEEVPAIAFLANPERVRTGLTPSDEYLGRILTGAAEHALPDDYVAAIRREAGR